MVIVSLVQRLLEDLELGNPLNYDWNIFRIIRIYHECEGRIEKSVPRIAVWHHKACRVMINGDPEGRTFLSYLTPIMDSFSCSPLFLFIYLFIFEKCLQKSLNTLRCNFT